MFHSIFLLLHNLIKILLYGREFIKPPRDNSDEKSIGGHAILIVGYDMEDGEDYYLIQNSYGKQWGLNVVLGSAPLGFTPGSMYTLFGVLYLCHIHVVLVS